jgi:hypothetical protein
VARSSARLIVPGALAYVFTRAGTVHRVRHPDRRRRAVIAAAPARSRCGATSVAAAAWTREAAQGPEPCRRRPARPCHAGPGCARYPPHLVRIPFQGVALFRRAQPLSLVYEEVFHLDSRAGVRSPSRRRAAGRSPGVPFVMPWVARWRCGDPRLPAALRGPGRGGRRLSWGPRLRPQRVLAIAQARAAGGLERERWPPPSSRCCRWSRRPPAGPSAGLTHDRRVRGPRIAIFFRSSRHLRRLWRARVQQMLVMVPRHP